MRFRVDFNDTYDKDLVLADFDDADWFVSELGLIPGAEVQLHDGSGHECVGRVVRVVGVDGNPRAVEVKIDWPTWRAASSAYRRVYDFHATADVVGQLMEHPLPA